MIRGGAFLLLAAALVLIGAACDGGGDGPAGTDATATAPAAAVEIVTGPDGCVDREALPAPGPYEVGAEPIFFRFGFPAEALRSGSICVDQLRLVSIRVVGDGGGEAPVLSMTNADGGEEIEVPTEPVVVPGEEDLGSFFNALVELPGPGRWLFSVEAGGGSASYLVIVRAPEGG